MPRPRPLSVQSRPFHALLGEGLTQAPASVCGHSGGPCKSGGSPAPTRSAPCGWANAVPGKAKALARLPDSGCPSSLPPSLWASISPSVEWGWWAHPAEPLRGRTCPEPEWVPPSSPVPAPAPPGLCPSLPQGLPQGHHAEPGKEWGGRAGHEALGAVISGKGAPQMDEETAVRTAGGPGFHPFLEAAGFGGLVLWQRTGRDTPLRMSTPSPGAAVSTRARQRAHGGRAHAQGPGSCRPPARGRLASPRCGLWLSVLCCEAAAGGGSL